MNRTLFILLTSIVALVAMVLLLREPKPVASSGRSITVFCAASNRAVMEAIRADYEKESGRSVQVQYGASQTLLSSIEVSQTGDLYLPADDSFLLLAREKNLVAEQIPLATMRAVVAVQKGNPKGIASLADLLKPGLRLVQANPDAAAIGKLTRATLLASGQWESLDNATTAYRTTVNDVANDLVVGAADAGIVYDAVLHTYPQLEAIHIEELEPAVSNVAIGVIASSKQPSAVLHFARYVAAKDRGQKHYLQHGFQVATGDTWADVPEISLFAGSMLRPAIEDNITEFEKREGVRVNRVYNGCGILVAQLKSGQRPDAYFACDREFMNQVPDLFPTPIDVSENELVILVQKGNPQKIADLNDLARKGLRVGIGHEKQCAMGWLTQNTLKEGGVQKEVMENVTVQTPTGDMLVNQIRTGSLDAAVVYLSNAAGAGEELDAIRIHGIECSIATQPFAVSKETRYPQLTERLFERLCSAESRESFEAEGFRWQKK
jgi:molybdate transport system substrate-binding protein